jgi:hypothetical protein
MLSQLTITDVQRGVNALQTQDRKGTGSNLAVKNVCDHLLVEDGGHENPVFVCGLRPRGVTRCVLPLPNGPGSGSSNHASSLA